MSLDVPIVWTGKSRSAPATERHNMISPATFRLNIAPTAMETGLKFQDAHMQRKDLSFGAVSRDSLLKPDTEVTEVRLARGVSRMMFASMVMIVIVLCILIFTLLYLSYRFNNNVNYYYYAAEPYLEELKERGMSMVRHADRSSASLEHVMVGTESMASQSIPELMKTVNQTTSMIARLERVARNPVLKVSME